MSKSLTEVAKAVLMNEGAIPSVSSTQSNPDAQATYLTPNKATLRPGSRGPEGRFANPGAMSPDAGNVQDLGPTPTTQAFLTPAKAANGVAATVGGNRGAAAAAPIGKDTSQSSQSRKGAVPAEKTKKQAEVMEEDYELDEEEQLDEISGDLVGRAASIAQDRAEAEGDAGNNRLARAFRNQSNRLYKKSAEKFAKEKAQKEDEKISSGKRAKEKMDEEIELSEELEAFIMEMIEEGYSEDQIVSAIEENFELVSEEVEELDEEESYQVDMSEHVEALLAGEELSEEFKEKATTIFEAAVQQKLAEEIAKLEEAYAEALEEEVAEITQSLSEDVDDYLNYVVENWVSENEVAIEHGLRTELTEDFISGLRNLFVENYIDIPEDKVSVVEELGSKIEELEAKLNEEIEHNVALNKMINESKQYEILSSACDGLTVTQAEKLKALSEGIEFTTESEYNAKIKTLRESYFSAGVKADNVLDRVESENDGRTMISEDTNPRMAAYVKTLGKKLPN